MVRGEVLSDIKAGPARVDVATPSPDRGRVLMFGLVTLAYLVAVLGRWWLVRDVITPAAHSDEDGYLIAARVLAGGVGGETSDNATFHRVGYPLLLSPIYWFTSDAFTVYRAMHVLNACLNALVLPLAYVFARRVLATSRLWSFAMAALVGSLPAVAFYSQFALPDAIMAPLGLGYLLLLHGWLTGRSARSRMAAALGAGVVVGYMHVVHVRGLVMVAVHLAVVAALWWLRRGSGRAALASVASLVVVMQLDWVLKLALGNEIQRYGRNPDGRLLYGLVTPSGLLRTVNDATGQFWYAGIATWGVGFVALVVTGRWIWTQIEAIRAGDRRLQHSGGEVEWSRWFVIGIALVASLGVAILSAAALPPDARINYHAYPRYIGFLFPIWLMVGLWTLTQLDWRQRGDKRRILAAGALLAITGYLVATNVSGRYQREKFLAFDGPEASFLSGGWGQLHAIQATAAATVLFGLFVLLFTRPHLLRLPRRRAALLAVLGILALNAATLYAATQHVTVKMTAYQYATGPRLERDAGVQPGDVVATAEKVPWWLPNNHMREVYWSRLITFDAAFNGPPPREATVVIAPWHDTRLGAEWDGTRYGFRFVTGDDKQRWAVWRRA